MAYEDIPTLFDRTMNPERVAPDAHTWAPVALIALMGAERALSEGRALTDEEMNNLRGYISMCDTETVGRSAALALKVMNNT